MSAQAQPPRDYTLYPVCFEALGTDACCRAITGAWEVESREAKQNTQRIHGLDFQCVVYKLGPGQTSTDDDVGGRAIDRITATWSMNCPPLYPIRDIFAAWNRFGPRRSNLYEKGQCESGLDDPTIRNAQLILAGSKACKDAKVVVNVDGTIAGLAIKVSDPATRIPAVQGGSKKASLLSWGDSEGHLLAKESDSVQLILPNPEPNTIYRACAAAAEGQGNLVMTIETVT